jgi:DNA-directed RNA polymerase subunit RPC12/RpoP
MGKKLIKMPEELKALSCTCEDCGDWFAVEEEAFNDKREDKIKCPYCQSYDIRKLGIIIYR